MNNMGGLWLSKKYQTLLEDKDIANLPALIGNVNGVEVVCFANKYKYKVNDNKPFYVVYKNKKKNSPFEAPAETPAGDGIPF